MCYNAGEDKMSQKISNDKQAGVERGEWLKKKIIPLLTLLLVVAITVTIFLCRERITELGNYGYLGAFLVSLVSNATIVLPVPGIIIIMALGATLPPVFVGLAAGIGSAIGEMTAYVVGVGGRGLVENRRLYDRLVEWLRKWGVMIIFLFALTPLPFDLLGIVAGVLRFPLWKFFLACWLGKTLLNIIIAYAGFYGWEFVLPYFS